MKETIFEKYTKIYNFKGCNNRGRKRKRMVLEKYISRTENNLID